MGKLVDPQTAPHLRKLLNQLREEGLHLHYYEASGIWMTINRNWSPLCDTDRCFRLRLKNVAKESRGESGT